MDVQPKTDQRTQSIGGEKRPIAQRVWGIGTTPDGDRYDGTAQETEWSWEWVPDDPNMDPDDPDYPGTGTWQSTVIRDEQVDWTAEADDANKRFENEQEGSVTKNRYSYFISEGDWYETFGGTSNDTQRDQYNIKTADTIEKLCKQVASLTKAVNALGGGDESELG